AMSISVVPRLRPNSVSRTMPPTARVRPSAPSRQAKNGCAAASQSAAASRFNASSLIVAGLDQDRIAEPPRQVCRDPPDAMPVMVDLPTPALLATIDRPKLSITRFGSKRFKRHLEDRIHLARIGNEGSARIDYRHDRRDEIIGAGIVIGHVPEHLRVLGMECDLLIGLPQRGIGRI